MPAPEPLVSVVLPTHNRAHLLPSAARSVLGQTYQNIELVIVDDGSTDQTPQTVAQIAANDPRVKTLRNDPNVRLPAALNRGFAIAKGELLTWTSDDNLYRPNAIARLVQTLQENPEAGLAYSDMALIDENGDTVGHQPAPPPDRILNEAVCGACFLYRRDLAETVGPYAEDLFLAEDFDYWVRCALKSRFVPIPEDLYLYRHHPGSLSAQYTSRVGDVMAQVVERHIDAFPHLPAQNLAEARLALAARALAENDKPRLRRHLRQALRLSPALTLKRFKRGLLAALMP